MAFILKNPTQENKGIIMLTHKETNLNNLLKKYRSRYLIGVHVGWDLSNNSNSVMSFKPDFVLSSFSHLGHNVPRDIVIELNARNFLPNHFNFENKDKNQLLESIIKLNEASDPQIAKRIIDKVNVTEDANVWDIIWVNRPTINKQIKSFLDNLKRLFEVYGMYETLIVCGYTKAEKEDINHKSYFDVETYINKIFTEKEREYISLSRPWAGEGCLGISTYYIAPLYHWSKVYTFYSGVEGDARSLHEALCGKCKVIYYKNLKGAGKDYLDKDNSLYFENYSESYKTLYNAIQDDKEFDLDFINSKCFQSNSFKVLKDELVKIYKKNGEDFDGILNEEYSLNLELAAHNEKTAPWKDPSKVTADLIPKNFDKFVKHSTILMDGDGNEIIF